MKFLSKSVLLLLLVMIGIVLSCKKEDDNPKPTTNPITGNLTITGITGADVSIDASGTTYTISVPKGTDVKGLKIQIPVSTGATISPDPDVARDYTNPVSFTITSTDGSTTKITIKVVVQSGTGTTKSSEKQITAFTFAALNPVVSVTINQSTYKITATVPSNTDLTNLMPSLNLSAKATVSPASGVAQNFTNAVNYTVTAEDGTKQIYEVKIEKAIVVPSNLPCLLTREESTIGSDNYIIDYTYDTKGRMVNIKIVKNGETSNSAIEYDQNGDVSRIKIIERNNYSREYRLTYQNRKIMKLEGIGSDGIIIDLISLWHLKFNDKNEMIEMSIGNAPTDLIKFEYTNGNLSKSISYDEDKRKFVTVDNVTYDNKNSPTSSSNPHGIFTFIYFIGGFQGVFSPPYSKNNIVGYKRDGVQELITLAYTFNKDNFPTELKVEEQSPVRKEVHKYTYSNCQ